MKQGYLKLKHLPVLPCCLTLVLGVLAKVFFSNAPKRISTRLQLGIPVLRLNPHPLRLIASGLCCPALIDLTTHIPFSKAAIQRAMNLHVQLASKDLNTACLEKYFEIYNQPSEESLIHFDGQSRFLPKLILFMLVSHLSSPSQHALHQSSLGMCIIVPFGCPNGFFVRRSLLWDL